MHVRLYTLHSLTQFELPKPPKGDYNHNYTALRVKADSPIDADCVAVRLYTLAVHCTPPATRHNTLGVENKEPPATALAGDGPMVATLAQQDLRRRRPFCNEPNRSALQQRRGGCRDRSEFKNRTEQNQLHRGTDGPPGAPLSRAPTALQPRSHGHEAR